MDRTHALDVLSCFSVLYNHEKYYWASLVVENNADSQIPVTTGTTAIPQIKKKVDVVL